MPENGQTTTLRKFELGMLVTLALAVIGFAFWISGLERKVALTNHDKLKEIFDSKLTATVSGGVVPTGAIIAWSASSEKMPDGWISCDGAPGSGTPDLRERLLRDGFNRKGENVRGTTNEQNQIMYLMKK